MEVRNRKSTFALVLFLVILTSLGFAFNEVFTTIQENHPGPSAQDTTVRRKAPPADSIYRDHLWTADKLIQQKKYDAALAELEKAQLMRPNEPTLKTRITQVKAMAAQQKKDDEEFKQLISSADKYFTAKDYLNAKATYQLALNLKPDDAYAKGKLNETMGFLRSQKAQNILYDVAVANADKFFEAGELDKAKAEYEKASQILPSDQYAKERVNEIIKIQVDKQVREELYTQAITKADQFYNTKKYQGALTEYKNALKQKPDEQYPKDRIAELTELLNQLKALEEAYQKAIAAADQFFMAKRYPDARGGYEDALKIKPNEAYPKNRIREIDGILAGMQRSMEAYDGYITLADSFYIEKNFVLARQNYQLALQVKPGEAYPKEMIAKTEQGMSAQELSAKTLEEAYAASISKADKLFTEKSWEDARREYNGALTLKPAESYPKSRIGEIDKILEGLAKQKELEDQYASTIGDADRLLADKAYAEAKAKYQAASTLKPSEQYPKTRITEIDGILAGLQKQRAAEEQYASFIASGDKSFAAKAWDAALAAFNQALAIKPDELYPKEKISEIGKIKSELALQKELDDRYTALIVSADKLFLAKTWVDSRKTYTEALALKPEEKYPQEQITKIDAALGDIAKQQAIEEQYKGVITIADQLLSEKNYDESKEKYNEALTIKPAESYPRTKIAEIDGILADIAKRKSIDDQYATAITAADGLFGQKSYAEAKTGYQSAAAIKPGEEYPKTKIAEIDGIFAEIAKKQKELEDSYAALLSAADKLYADRSYEEARKGYTGALGLKPAEKYPQDQIAKIDAALGDLARQKAIDEQYAGVISTADQLLAGKQYGESKAKYNEALTIKPTESYPKTKIAEIEGILAEIAKQKSIDDQYLAAIVAADGLFGQKSYADAKAKFQAASAIKPGEEYPKTKIAEIDGIFAEIARKNKELEDNYAALVASADKLFASKTYEDSRKAYTDALALKPAEKYPTDQIAKIDAALGEIARQRAIDGQYAGVITSADQLLAEKKYDVARTRYNEALAIKPAETYPKAKIAEIDAALAEIARLKDIDDRYSAAVAEADARFTAKSYAEAKAGYQSASAIKPAEQYPKTRIAEIDGIFAAEAARLKDIDDRYNLALAGGARLFAEKSYEPAKAEYLKASEIKPGEQLPKDRIAEIDAILADLAAKRALDDQYAGLIGAADKLLAGKKYDEAKAKYNEALAVKPSEPYPKTKIAEIDGALAELARLKEIDDRYAAAIAEADALFAAQTWNDARTKYQAASAIKPGEEYPRTRIAEADKMLADIARQKAIDDQYNGIIVKADQLLTAKSYAEAKTEYQSALKVKSAEQYPKDKISEIDGILAEIAKQKSIADQYKGQLAKADQLFSTKQYEQAMTEYTAALAIKADEQYPKDRIAEIQGILAEFKARDDAYKASVAKADQLLAEKNYEGARTEYQNAGAIKPSEQYPKDKISEISRILTELQGKKVTYDNLVKSAADLLSEKEYNKSKELYQQASGIFPEEALPKERIAYITRTVDSIYRANKGQYDIAVANGDKAFAAFEFDKAIDAYTEASGYLPMESYPKEQIAKIRRTIAENAIVDVLKTPVTITAGDEKKFTFEPVNIAARKDNFVYLRIRNLSGKQFNILMRYGRDAQANGGVVVRNVSVDGKVNERLISVRDQDLWYRADNNWISLYPQGGDIEVSFIQVSRVR